MKVYKTVKNSRGEYEKVEVDVDSTPPKSLDELLDEGRTIVERAMDSIKVKAVSGAIERGDIQNLKDLMAMLKDLKEREDEYLQGMSDDQLKELADK